MQTITRTSRRLLGATLALALAAAGCAGGEGSAGRDTAPAAGGGTPGAPQAGGPVTPGPGGKVIAVEMLTDDQGNNVFRPAEFEASRGDVIRYTLVSGVHNATFLPDSNPGKAGLPAAGPLLQLPGQTHDVAVSFEPGRYYFQCDPHALLGMTGHVTVK